MRNSAAHDAAQRPKDIVHRLEKLSAALED